VPAPSFARSAVAGLCLLTLPHAAAAGWWQNERIVEIRAGPGIAYATVAVVPRHGHLRVYGCTAWCDVTWGTYHGYVQTAYVLRGHGRFADHITASPAGEGGTLTPVYVPPAPAYLTSQVLAPVDRYEAEPVGRIWYYQGRFLDRPDYFYDLRR
jgi:uncharacterized protein YraI